mmetsp:Transcript_4589/g.8659  ORF Transcript_4589/g.8659 Transcript_4589/m.8659 type:complete len:259 (+) Transcript_4589:641-1417(+)
MVRASRSCFVFCCICWCKVSISRMRFALVLFACSSWLSLSSNCCIASSKSCSACLAWAVTVFTASSLAMSWPTASSSSDSRRRTSAINESVFGLSVVRWSDSKASFARCTCWSLAAISSITSSMHFSAYRSASSFAANSLSASSSSVSTRRISSALVRRLALACSNSCSAFCRCCLSTRTSPPAAGMGETASLSAASSKSFSSCWMSASCWDILAWARASSCWRAAVSAAPPETSAFMPAELGWRLSSASSFSFAATV